MQEFVTCDNWFHLDIAGIADNSDEVTMLWVHLHRRFHGAFSPLKVVNFQIP
jgi:hypothetical protein